MRYPDLRSSIPSHFLNPPCDIQLHSVHRMTFPHPSSASLNILHRADGSATYSQNGYTIIGAVNGPVEVQRRDELPEEAAIEVNVRPAVGVGGTLPPTPPESARNVGTNTTHTQA